PHPPRAVSDLPTPGPGVRALASGRLLPGHVAAGGGTRGRAQGRDRPSPGPTPPPRAATPRAQGRHHHRRRGPVFPPRAVAAARATTRQARPQTPRLRPPPRRRAVRRTAGRPTAVFLLRTALHRLPRYRGRHRPGDRGPGPSADLPATALSPPLLLWGPSRDHHRTAPRPRHPQEPPGPLR